MKTRPIPTESWKTESWIFLLVVCSGILFQLTNTLDFFLVPRFLALSMGLAFILIVFVFNQKQLEFQLNVVTVSFIVYLSLHFLSILWANVKSEAIFHSEKVFLSFLLFWIASELFKKSTDLFLHIAKLLSFVSVILIPVVYSQMTKMEHFDADSFYVVSAWSGHRNLFSCFLFLNLPFYLYGFQHSSPKWKQAFGFLIFICVVFILILQTRAVWMGLAVTGVVMSILMGLKWKNGELKNNSIKWSKIGLVGFLALTALFILLYLNHGLDSFLSRINILNFSNSASGSERLAVWDKTFDLIKEHFWLGVGAGNWQLMYLKFSVSGISEALEGATFQRPHNDFLWIFSEIGIFGLITFILLFTIPIFRSLRSFNREKFSKEQSLKLYIPSFLVGFLTISFFDFPRERIDLLILSFLLLAFVYSEENIPSLYFKTKPKYFLLIITLLIFCVTTSVYRIKGELNVRKMFKAKNERNSNMLRKYSDRASSLFYEIDPASMPIAWYKGISYTQQNEYQNGYIEFKKAYQLSRYNHIVNNNLGVCLLRENKVQEAEAFFLEAARIQPKYDEPKLNLVVIYFNNKEFEKAMNYVNQCDSSLTRTKRYKKLLLPLVSKK